MKDFLFLAFNNLKRRRLRSWLTILGILIGISAIVAFISLGQGLENYINEQFEQFGTNKLLIMPGSGTYFGAFTGNKLTKDDLNTVKNVGGVGVATEMFYKSGQIKFRDEAKETLIIGLPTDENARIVTEMEGFDLEQGRSLEKGDRYNIQVGWFLWDGDFFKRKVGLRDRIEIRGKEFKVVGLVKKIGNRGDDSQVYIPIDVAREIFNASDEISTIFIEIKGGLEPEEVAENIKKELRDARNEKRGEETFSIQTFEQVMQSVSDILSIVQAVVIGIASIALIVGGIGIMNTMYTSVLERTKEIGTMKAVGAKNSDILLIFLFESGLIGLIGGFMGLVFGMGISKIIEYVISNFFGTTLLKISFNFGLVFFVLVFSFVIGCISGILPALQAAKLRPAEALRYE